MVVRASSLRLVVCNRDGNPHRRRRSRWTRDERHSMYAAPVEPGEPWTGLKIVAELVGRAYGVVEQARLVDDGYVGIEEDAGVVASWFHWPVAGEPATAEGPSGEAPR